MKWIFLMLGVLANASASILIKAGIGYGFEPQFSLRCLLDFIKNWQLMLGIVLYGLAFLLYALSLSRLPLNIVHPTMTSGSIALVGICAYLVFHERFSIITIAGYCFILRGVFLVTFSK